jgi:hypothetical protein
MSAMDRAFAGVPELVPVARAALGRELVAVERLTGGTKKGVYRLTLAGGGTAVLYVWSAEENFWPERDAPDDVFADASGLDLFEAAHAALSAAGVRAPALHWTDASHALHPADLAVVEDLPGPTLEDAVAAGRTEAVPELAGMLARMAAVRDPRIGKVGRPDRSGRDCVRIVLDTADRDLAEAAERAPAIAPARAALADRLAELAAAVQPRSGHALVHGELGFDHVVLAAGGHPVLVDIEGLTWFDAEWEHAFIGMRQRDPAVVRPPGLDEARLALYRLARHLSLVAGPLRLAATDFPDRDFMLEIAAHHQTMALGYLS